MSDQFREHLKTKGWTAIPFPSSEFRLLTLLWERNRARGHSNDFEFLAPGIAPRVMPPEVIDKIGDLNGAATDKKDFSLGISILSGLIGALGGGTLGLKAGFKPESKLTFTYSGLTGEAISPVGLQMGMNTCPAPMHGLLNEWLNDNLFIATAVLRAKSIKVNVSDSRGAELGVEVPVIKEAVGANIGFSSSGSANSELEFEGEHGAPIGLRLFKVTTVKQGRGKFLDLASTKQGFAIRDFDPDSDYEFLENAGAEHEPAPVWVDWSEE